MTKQEFIEKGKAIYGDKYDYKFIKNDIIENNNSVPLYCSKHGVFYTNVYHFLNGQACFNCFVEDKEE